jgi:hypothetical protein
MYSQVDKDNHHHIYLDNIVNFWKNESAIGKEDVFVEMHNGVKQQRQMTQGWQLLCPWKDGSINWVALTGDRNKFYPVQVADNARANHIGDKPAFAWWVPHVFKKQ